MSVAEPPNISRQPLAPLAIVVAVAENGVIGNKGALPWHLPEDLRHFKSVTMGHAIIMGRKTYESIGKPLPGRRSIVVSRTLAVTEGVEVTRSLAEAVAIARAAAPESVGEWAGDDEPRVIGGAALFEEALPIATRLFLTRVAASPEGDVHFPRWDESTWREVSRRKGDDVSLEFVELGRRVI